MGVRTFKKADKTAYAGIGIYALIHVAWLVWFFSTGGKAVFDTVNLIGIGLPGVALLALIGHQWFAREGRFSILATTMVVGAIVGWFFFIWYVVMLAATAFV
jgi:hypothetical protein